MEKSGILRVKMATLTTVSLSCLPHWSLGTSRKPGLPSVFCTTSFSGSRDRSSAKANLLVLLPRASFRAPLSAKGSTGAEKTPIGGDGSGGKGNEGGGHSESDRGENAGGSSDREKKAMSMSQKLTLAYAALVGIGGVAGYLKSGSQKSVAAGGLSALLLYYVYTALPTKPVLASALGLGVSAALLAVMGSRFNRSGKVFPSGVVALVSLVMTGGYFHGILRSLH